MFAFLGVNCCLHIQDRRESRARERTLLLGNKGKDWDYERTNGSNVNGLGTCGA
jgi:hypothetical protein